MLSHHVESLSKNSYKGLRTTSASKHYYYYSYNSWSAYSKTVRSYCAFSASASASASASHTHVPHFVSNYSSVDKGGFKLSKAFVDKFKNERPPFGFNGLGELVYRRTYSRVKEDGKNEEWYLITTHRH
jgi:hypothetical protein